MTFEAQFKKNSSPCAVSLMKLFNENRIVLTRGKDKSLSCAAFSFKGGEWWESSNDDRLMVKKDLGG